MGMVDPASDAADPVRAGNIFLGGILSGAGWRPDTLGHAVAIKDVTPGEVLTYYAGSGWSQGGVEDMEAWTRDIAETAAAATEPLQVSVR